MSLRLRLLVALLPAILSLSLALTALALSGSKRSLEEEIKRESRALAESHAGRFDLVFEKARIVAEDLALAVAADRQLDSGRIEQRIRDVLDVHPFVYGSTVSLVPGATSLGRFAPYLHRTESGVRSVSLASSEYDYPSWDWFCRPLADGEGSWSEPYFDEGGGNILMMTYSAPVRLGGKTVGVATVDVSIAGLVDKLRALRVADTGYAFLISSKGRLFAHPSSAEPTEQGSAFNTKDFQAYAGAVSVPGRMIEMSDPYLGKTSWVMSSGIASADATLMLVLPLDEILRPVAELRQEMILAAALIIGITLLVIMALAANVTAPLSRLVRQAQRFAEGHFDERLPQDAGPRETRELSATINRLGAAIVEHVEEVRAATAEKERYHKELQIAAEIQQGILPHAFPPFPELAPQLDLYGLTRPAREVGGDYYDFFLLSPNRIALVVADVSDKGLAAALFMAITHTQIRAVARQGLPPAETLRRVNATLAAENPSSMFVTLVYGEYRAETGRLTLTNAGHNPPLLRRADGGVEVLAAEGRLPLGAMPGSRYQTTEIRLEPGDCLLLYSDGVTEAAGPSGEEWGLERLRLLLGERQGDSPELSRAVLDKVDAFCSPAEQHDDITLLLLQRRAAAEDVAHVPERTESVRLEWPARTEVLEEVASLVGSIARKIGFDAAEANRLVLAVDEVVTNVITHGQGGVSRFAMEITRLDRGIEVAVIDWGEPYDFEAKSQAYDGRATLAQPPGGIGIYLARRSVDEMHYYPGAADGNRLVLVKYRTLARNGEPSRSSAGVGGQRRPTS